MEAKELRLGNLILYRDEPREVSSISKFTITFYNEYWVDDPIIDLDFFRLKPMLLTDEYLLKIGFEKHHMDYFFKRYDIDDFRSEVEISESSDGNGFILCVSYNEYWIGEPFLYVHQLQNLWFSLTGKELEV